MEVNEERACAHTYFLEVTGSLPISLGLKELATHITQPFQKKVMALVCDLVYYKASIFPTCN